MQALILTGGQGKRMRPLTNKIPKPLLPVEGQPFLAFLINFLKNQEVEEFILATGYKGEMIENYFGTGSKFKTKIIYSREKTPLDTAGPIKKAENLIKDKDILILNGDSFINVNLKEMLKFHQKMGEPITMAVTRVKDSSRSGQAMINKKSIITEFKEKDERKKEGFINAGVYIFQKKILKDFPRNKKISLEKEIFPQSVGRIAAFKTRGYFIDIGAKEDYEKFNKDIKKLSPKIKNVFFNKSKKAIFFDRDGVTNKEKGYVHKIKDFEWEKNALKGLKSIDFNEYLVFFVSNQAGIARGYYSKKDFENFDSQIKELLLEKGVKITKTYYCPHHPEAKIAEFKKECSCRKPEIGLLLKAEKEFNIDFKKSYFIGDKTSDILAGKRAGCKTILVKTGYGGKDKLFSVKPDFITKDLLEAIRIINPVEKFRKVPTGQIKKFQRNF